jgi:hypothetical protein
MDYLNEFRESVCDFLDELLEQFPNETDFILARIFIKDKIPPQTIMSYFIKDILPLKDSILKRDESFFLTSDLNFLGSSGSDKVNHFRLLWKSTRLDKQDRDVIWKWFESFVYMAEQYQQHLVREAASRVDQQG